MLAQELLWLKTFESVCFGGDRQQRLWDGMAESLLGSQGIPMVRRGMGRVARGAPSPTLAVCFLCSTCRGKAKVCGQCDQRRAAGDKRCDEIGRRCDRWGEADGRHLWVQCTSLGLRQNAGAHLVGSSSKRSIRSHSYLQMRFSKRKEMAESKPLAMRVGSCKRQWKVRYKNFNKHN